LRTARAGLAGLVTATLTATLVACCLLAAPAGANSGTGGPTAAQRALAKKALLVLSDLPKGWTRSSSGGGGGGSFPGASQLAKCLGVPTSIITGSAPSENSPLFTSPSQNVSVSDSVSIDPSAAYAKEDFNALANPKSPRCLTAALNGPARSELENGAPQGVTLGSVQVTRIAAADLGPHTANFAAFFPVTSQGTVINAEILVVDFAKGNLEQTVTFTAFDGTVPQSISHHLTTLADGRL
jgi:hypothetical protein